MEILIKASQLILSLSILVTLHELGHFIPAKLFKTRVEKFYLFFDFLFPFPNIGNFSLFKITKGGTEYGLGWFPFGGYVKISGMVDESMDKEQMAKPPEPWEFRSKPAWQRLIIMMGGVTVNFVLAMVIYAMVLFVWGKEYVPMQNATYGLHCDSLALDLGFKDGDKIIALNGVAVTNEQTVNHITKAILLDNITEATVSRNGSELNIKIPESFPEKVVAARVKGLFALRIPVVVDTLIAGQPAKEAGLKKGDSIVGINNLEASYFGDFVREIQQFKGQDIELQLYRKGEPVSLKIKVTDNATIGFGNADPTRFFSYNKREYGLFESFPAGIQEANNTLADYISQFKLVFTQAGIKQIGGFGAMGNMFAPTWDWHSFWVMTALISVILAFMNLLPIPMLDGGYVFFLIIEMIIRRPVPDKVIEYANMLGLAIVLLLLVYANGMDIFRLFQ